MNSRNILSLAAVTLAFQLAGCREEKPQDRSGELLGAIVKLEHQLAGMEKKLEQRMTALQDKIDKLEKSRQGSVAISNHHAGGPSAEKLNKIKFPEKPDKDNLRKYVAEIIAATRGQNTFSNSDPQVEMLAKVGEENIDILIDARKKGQPQYHPFHINYAINQIVTEKSKDKIIAMLPECQDLIGAVVKNGWENDAREAMIKIIKSRPQYIHHELLSAMVNLNDPKTYDDLKDYFIYGNNQAMTYNQIKNLPIPGLDKAVIDAWDVALTSSNTWNTVGMSVIALGAGRKDAYDIIFDGMASKEHVHMRPQLIGALRRHSDCQGSLEQLREWYSKNAANLVFDPQDKRFKIKSPAVKSGA